jgi:hypothetical protein
METLREKQSRFALMVARLLLKSAALGYEVTLGDAYRDERCPYGHQRSLHKKRLAIDLNLFKDGIFVRTTEGHKELGEWWESIGGSWGGRFQDAPHFSLSHGGMR